MYKSKVCASFALEVWVFELTCSESGRGKIGRGAVLLLITVCGMASLEIGML